MKLVTVKNTLPGKLDLAPLREEDGRGLVFRGNETRDLSEEQLGHPVIQRVLASKWLVIVDDAAPAAAPPVSQPIPVVKTSAPPEELKMPTMSSEPENLPEAPAASVEAVLPTATTETTGISETSVATEPARETPPAPFSRSSKLPKK